MATVSLQALPPVEAVNYFRDKGLVAGFDWRDVWGLEHGVAFTVAKAMSLDLLADIREAVDRAIADGVTFDQFREYLQPVLEGRGWWGRQTMVDPLTGEARQVQLGSRRRLSIIFDTNLRTAYAAGRWQRITRRADRRPWLRYVAVQDARTRPDHQRWHGTILRWDDPFWDTHAPPNGWKCRCILQQLSDADLTRRGYAVSPDAPPIELRPWANKRTGRIEMIPEGIDPGFQLNAGRIDRMADAEARLREKAAAIAASTGMQISHIYTTGRAGQ